MKFDFCIGNPPYQDESNGELRNYAPPVYHLFLDEAYKVAEKVELIHPARFLFNAGSTPTTWNQKMLQDTHFKVLLFDQNSDTFFPTLSTPIKGGIAITYHDNKNEFGSIEVYSQFSELNEISLKVRNHKQFSPLSNIVYSRTSYRLTDKLHKDFPEAINQLSDGHAYDMASNIFQRIPEVFYDEVPQDGLDYIGIIGRDNNQRVIKFIRKDYVNNPENLDSYKLLLAQANGNGTFGEVLSQPIIGKPGYGSTESFISIGNFTKENEAKSIEKYIKSKFARTMLGILKVTQNGNKPVWKYVPLQDFSSNSDIDWNVSIANIDRQLYKKYGLSAEEIEFIETHVKEME